MQTIQRGTVYGQWNSPEISGEFPLFFKNGGKQIEFPSRASRNIHKKEVQMEHGFQNDGEFINHVATWLRARATHIFIGREMREAERAHQEGEEDHQDKPVSELRCRGLLAKERKAQAHAELESRLDAHRADPTKTTLGIDMLVEQYRLTDEERLLLLTALMPAISQTMADDVLGGVGSFYGAISVSDLIPILDPKSPGDWIDARRHFMPDAPLVMGGLLVIDAHKPVHESPDALLDATVSVSMGAFQTLIGAE